ncbi:multidrug efflux MFS transporter EfpA [Mycobacterium cookii]|uniref:Putative MFS-type transporter EfpA n=1 Tax=Mycobacterium cookii TaxID=1775 RepID=A0A7I7KYW0_9MYCO|nr:MFS transporter [Mycobacterium cookii]MCV7331654.1 MFS transporter [Mycobacterium cookii]BBX46946.1 putative MFS-type transporter EfpA [Mycobacterium cookii]
MAALDDTERALPPWTTHSAGCATPTSAEPTRLSSRQFISVLIALGGIQLMASMDGPVVVFALPKIQNELGLSDAARSWVITAYALTFGGLILLGGRLGDAIGRKRTLIAGVALFTSASTICGVAWDGGALVVARLLHGAAAAIVVPTCVALVATTFPKGPARNTATGVFGAMGAIGAVVGLVVGGALTGVSWRLAFLVNVPLGLLVIYLVRTMLPETLRKPTRLDARGALLATLICTATVFGLSMGPERGWLSAATIGPGLVAITAFVVFLVLERTAQDPIVPFSLFSDRNRLAMFAAMFFSRGIGFTVTVLLAMYVQNIMGYSPLRAAVGFIPFAVAMAIATAVSSRLVMRFSPRAMVIAGSILLLGSTLYVSTLNAGVPYFPNLVLPLVVGAIGLGVINVPLGLSLYASVGIDRIGPASAIAVMLQSLGGPFVLVVIEVVITSRTLQLGGTGGPVKAMNAAQLHALEHGYTYGLQWLAGVVILLCGVGLLIGYTAQQVAHAQKVKGAIDAAEDSSVDLPSQIELS